jgi:hypothetical protein
MSNDSKGAAAPKREVTATDVQKAVVGYVKSAAGRAQIAGMGSDSVLVAEIDESSETTVYGFKTYTMVEIPTEHADEFKILMEKAVQGGVTSLPVLLGVVNGDRVDYQGKMLLDRERIENEAALTESEIVRNCNDFKRGEMIPKAIDILQKAQQRLVKMAEHSARLGEGDMVAAASDIDAAGYLMTVQAQLAYQCGVALHIAVYGDLRDDAADREES